MKSLHSSKFDANDVDLVNKFKAHKSFVGIFFFFFFALLVTLVVFEYKQLERFLQKSDTKTHQQPNLILIYVNKCVYDNKSK